MKSTKIQLFGIPNCDSVKKARVWLDGKGDKYDFQDFKKSKLQRQEIQFWCSIAGWESLVNKKSTTWRALTPEQREAVIDEQSACEALLNNPSLVKRPVLWREDPPQVVVGVQASVWEQLFANT